MKIYVCDSRKMAQGKILNDKLLLNNRLNSQNSSKMKNANIKLFYSMCLLISRISVTPYSAYTLYRRQTSTYDKNPSVSMCFKTSFRI